MKSNTFTRPGVFALGLGLLLTAALAQAKPAAELYNDVCATCHADGGDMGAPVVGDKEAWKPRIAKGKKALYRNAIQGTSKGMPDKHCYECAYSDKEIKAVVDLMVKRSR
ncbi:MAG TPA: c-type cytochrome [Fluviicoccus sp.]|nr:c-type cytochrome [Fluviicoccus sp.]